MHVLLRSCHGLLCLFTLCLLSLPFVAVSQAAETRPNIVMILADDVSWNDLGCYGHPSIRTPNLDRLAREGMRFTNAYAANPVCSPTRYSLMTGKYPTRVQATNWFSGVRTGRYLPAPLNDHMPLAEITLAEALKTADYQTAFLGKWHLGPTEEFGPENQGFDVNIGGHHRGSPPGGYFSPYKNPKLGDGPPGEHLTARLTDEAIKLLDQFDDRPFLLYLSFYTVHTPCKPPRHWSTNTSKNPSIWKLSRNSQRRNRSGPRRRRDRSVLSKITPLMPRWWKQWIQPSAGCSITSGCGVLKRIRSSAFFRITADFPHRKGHRPPTCPSAAEKAGFTRGGYENHA